jgi:DNA-binding GntR family transcriptional regulator
MSIDATLPRLEPRGATLRDDVYSVIAEAILDGRLEPGATLRDVDLAESLGVSRTPVREALQRLQRIGLVEVAANRWTRVSIPDQSLYESSREFMVYMMGNTLSIALPRCSDADLESAVRLIDEIIAASDADDHIRLVETNATFFRHLTLASGNRVLVRVLDEADYAMRRNTVGWQPYGECPEERRVDYLALREAVQARDGRIAEQLLRRRHGYL